MGELLRSAAPGLGSLSSYRRSWLSKDLVAGLVLTALLVPQGMAYAELAGLPPITGLYTSILCLVGYAIFGPSRILVLGPDSSLGPMIAATIIPIVGANGDPQRAIALASMLALLVGVMTVLAGIAKLGFVADLLSKPTQIGYMNGLALTILVGQLPKLFGFSVDADGLIPEAAGFARGLANGETAASALSVGLLGLVLIAGLQRLVPKIPAVLVAVVVLFLMANAFDLADRGVSLVGPLPQGFPPLTLPSVPMSDLALLVAGPGGPGGRWGPGDDRDRRGQHRRRVLSGVSRQHQRLPDRGGRAGRRQDPGHRAGRGAGHHGDALGGSRAAAQPPPTDPGRGRDRGVAVAARHPRHGPAVAATPHRVHALDGRVRRCRPAGGAARHRDCRGPVDRERVPPRVVAAPDGPRSGPGCAGLPRSGQLPRCRTAAGMCAVPLRRAPVLRQRPDLPRPGPQAGPVAADPGVDRGRGRAHHRRRHHGRRHAGGPR